MKAYRKEDGRLTLFRPDQNAIRLQIGAERMCMPSPSIDQFIDAVKQTALANKRWVINFKTFSLQEFSVLVSLLLMVNKLKLTGSSSWERVFVHKASTYGKWSYIRFGSGT